MSVSRVMFPLSLVLFEFAVYVSNDMIMPGMPNVLREFGAAPEMTSLALTAAMLGNASLQWLLGPLSDRYGRRPVLLAGLVLFVLACLAMWPVQSIGQFIGLRFIQGMGCCFVLTVGYPTVQEAFDEKTAVRIVALMANVSLLSPLFGPLAGAAVVTWWPWRVVFLLIAAIGVIAFAGLYRSMPELERTAPGELTPRGLWRAYRVPLASRRFWTGAVMTGLAVTPLLTWIAVGPIVLIERAGLSQIDYGVLQLPVFAALIAGNVILARQVGRWSYARLMWSGIACMLCGAAVSCVGVALVASGYLALMAGTAFCALGMGLFYGVVYRQTLFAVDGANRATVAGMLSMIMIIVSVGAIELAKSAYLAFGAQALSVSALLAVLCLSGAALSFKSSDESQAFAVKASG